MRKYAAFLKRPGFLRSVLVLAGGTASAQVISLLALPLLTRIYTPQNYSVLAIFTSMLAIFSVVACMRYEVAISLPEADEDAVNLLALSLGISLVFSVLMGLATLLFHELLFDFFISSGLSSYLWLVPIGVFLTSTNQAIQSWTARKKRFSTIARVRMTQALGSNGVQIGLGSTGATSSGLIFGFLVNSGAGFWGMLKAALKEDRGILSKVSIAGVGSVARRYVRFPKYSVLEALANNGGIQLPIILIASYAGAEAGFVALAMRVMLAPMTLVGNAVSQVHLTQAPSELRSGNLGPFSISILDGLVKTGVGPLIFLGAASPIIFPFAFGLQWARAGEMVLWMTPWFVMQFVTSPLSMTLHVTGNQKLALHVQLAGLALRISAVIVFVFSFPNWIVEAYAISGFIFYLAYFFVVARVSTMRAKDLFEMLAANAKFLVPWLFAAASLSIYRAV